VRNRAEEQFIQKTEDRAIRPNSKRKRYGRDEGETRTTPDAA
jgi:hypothetical protein